MQAEPRGVAPLDVDRAFRDVLERVPGAVYIQRGDGASITTYISPRAEELLGRPAAALVGSDDVWAELVHPDDHSTLSAADAQADLEGSFRCEYRLRTADGSYRWFRDEAHRHPSDDGVPLWIGVLVDIHDLKEAELELRAMESRYRSLLEQLPAATHVHALDGELPTLYHSPQIEELLGIDASGRTTADLWRDSVLPADHDAALNGMLAGARSGQPFTLEYRMVRADGRLIWVRDRCAVVHDVSGGPDVVQGFYTDITAQKHRERELQEAVQRFQTLAEQIPAVTYIEPVGGPVRPAYMSPQYESMFGYSPQERLADPGLWERLVHTEDRARVLAEIAALPEDAEGWSLEYRMVHREGSVVWVRDQAVLVRSDEAEALFYLGVLFDVTDSQLAHAELQRALGELQRADEIKNTFLTAVSHDLRTPLATILGNAVTLEHADELGLTDEERQSMLRSLSAKARRLTDLITDLLDIDRLTRGALEPRRAVEELASLLERVARDTDLLHDRTLQLDLRPTVVMVDRSMIERIVENLLANAAKHTPPNARIWLSVRAVGQGAEIVVADDGPGVPQSLRESLFDPFERGPSANPQSPGVGLGLSLVARFAELHGGRAWVEERAGGGAAFHVIVGGADS